MSREIGLMFQDWGVKAMMLPPGTPGRKTQTRRVIKPQPELIPADVAAFGATHWWPSKAVRSMVRLPTEVDMMACLAPIQVGDIMFVKEAWATPYGDGLIYYRADHERTHTDEGQKIKWHSSMMMPKKYARLRFPITRVRVQRLQDITEEGAMAEGVEQSTWQYSCQPYRNYHLKEGWLPGQGCSTAVSSFVSLWESINGPGSWASNPWVWVYEWA